jgi:PAS domain S-box-containing protein
MDTPLLTLIIEDVEDDALLLVRALQRGGYNPIYARVDTPEAMRAALARQKWDVVFSDYRMPRFSAETALAVLRESGADLPFIIVSGTVGEETAVSALKAGAHDFLIKGNYARLIPALERELREAKVRQDRLQAEANLRQIVDLIPHAIFVKDRHGRLIFANRRYTELAGSTPEVLVRRPLLDSTPTEDGADSDLQADQDVISAGQPRFIPEDLLTDPQGNVHIVQTTKVPFTPVGVPERAMLGISIEITELKRAEQALRAKDEELRSMSQQLWHTAKLATMGELAASIAHELNNPLATVSLRAEALLAQIPGDDPKRRAVVVIGQETDRMGRLVADLLQFSRRSNQQLSTVDMVEEVEKTLELIQYHLARRKVNMIREYAPDVSPVLADRQQLRQVLLNLFTNASDAMPQGGTLTVRISAGTLNGGLLAVVMEIADTGKGISPETLPHIWEPFFTTKPEGKGTGLGLAICRRIVEEHRGMINLTSQFGQGTTARVALPASPQTSTPMA